MKKELKLGFMMIILGMNHDSCLPVSVTSALITRAMRARFGELFAYYLHISTHSVYCRIPYPRKPDVQGPSAEPPSLSEKWNVWFGKGGSST